MTACFFVRIADPRLLEKMSFYADDIRILGELGFDVKIATKPQEIPFGCDLYYIWWFGWGALPLLAAKLSRRPGIVVGALHYQDPKSGYLAHPLLERMIMRWSVRSADAVLAISEVEHQGFVTLGASNSHLVYCGVAVPGVIEPWASRRNIVFSIGHLNRKISITRKGFDNVIRAIPIVAKAIPDVHFVMAGTTGGDFFLDKLAEEIGVHDRVTFPGQIDNKAREAYFSNCRVLAQPTEWEGFGLAQLEAMASGLPVVTSDAGAVREVVGPAGLYCNKESPEDIAEKLVFLLTNRSQWEKFSREGYDRAKIIFTLERRKQRIKEILTSISPAAFPPG